MESQDSPQRAASQDEAVKTTGRYQIQEELGHGANGVVYKAYDQLIGRTVALKAISVDRNIPNREELIERLKLEAKAAGKLDHPNIITIYDVVEEDDVIYLSMQFIQGKTLLTFIAEDRVPPISTFVGWADQILSAVGFAHAHGVIHRDLKPANLMLTSQGTIKILDFGIAKVGNETLTQAGMVVGTPSYMAPEQVSGKKIDHRADIFALGSVFYELVTGEKAFRGDVATVLYKIVNEDPVPPTLINPSIPGNIDAIIRQALAKNPKERFQSCDAMRVALLGQAALSNSKSSPHPAVTAAAVPAPRPNAFPHYLLKEIAPQRSALNKRSIAAVVLLAVIATLGWAFYARSQTGSFPAVLNLRAVANRAFASIKPGQPDQPVAQPTALDGREEAHTQPAPDGSGAPTAPPQETAAAGVSKSQPASDRAPARSSTTPTPDVTTNLQTPSSSDPSAIPHNDTTPELSAGNDASAESASASNLQPAGADSGEPSDASGKTATQPSTANPVKPNPPEAIATVDGFTANDIPQLMNQADAAEEHGDYALARSRYQLILKLDPNNSEARAGLYRVNATAPSH